MADLSTGGIFRRWNVESEGKKKEEEWEGWKLP